MAHFLASKDIPLHAIHTGTFEASDCLFIGPNRAIFGYGNRSDKSAVGEIIQNTIGIEIVGTYQVPPHVQHLLGTVNIVGEETALVRKGTPLDLMRLLSGAFSNIIALDETKEVRELQGRNVVALGPNKVMMPDDCPDTRSIYEKHGLEVLVTRIEEIRKGAGGLGCLTGILTRDKMT